MIKKFEQFTKNVKSLNEGYAYNPDYLTEFNELMSECANDNFGLLTKKGGFFKLKTPQTFYFYICEHGKYGDMGFGDISPKKIVSFELVEDYDELNSIEDLLGEKLMYSDDECIVAITDSGERIPVDYWTCPAETTLLINMTLR